jgi:CRISPR/Cas system-associated protein Cas7 (RAMP superfamily)
MTADKGWRGMSDADDTVSCIEERRRTHTLNIIRYLLVQALANSTRMIPVGFVFCLINETNFEYERRRNGTRDFM